MVDWSDAWKEAETAAIAPSVDVHHTIEFRHVSFVDGSLNPIAIRFIRDVQEDTPLKLEDEAALNGGETVTFIAMAFESDEPQFEEGRTPTSRLSIDNAQRYLMPLVEAAVAIKADLIVTYRQYRSDEPDGPVSGPYDYVMRNVTFSGTRMTGDIQIDNLADWKFPSKNYSITEFAGLQ